MRERNVEIRNDGLTLRGTLTLPDGEAAPPVVLFIHGSGQLDRNENTKRQSLNVFNDLARSFADAGYASLRYDKRGCGQSEGDYYRTGYHDLVSDAAAWMTYLASGAAGTFGPIYLLGHSEGTLIGAQVAGKNDAVAGLILVCPFVQDVESTLRQQAATVERDTRTMPGFAGVMSRLLAAAFGQPTQVQEKVLARIRSTDAPFIKFMFRKIEAKAFRELMALDPAQIYAQVKVPALVLGAEKDLQCDPGDVQRIAAILGDKATPHIEQDLTHILRKDAGAASFLAYGRLMKLPIDPCVAQLSVDWLRKQQQRVPELPGTIT